jgi:hypothetical protein
MLKIFTQNKDITREQSRYEYMASQVSFDDPLFLGSYKPFGSLYINCDNREVEEDAYLLIEFWNGDVWESVKDLSDLTFGLSRPGFVKWEIPRNSKKITINGIEQHWFRASLSDQESIQFRGISVLFSDDFDLVSEYPDIMNNIPEGQSSFIRFHDQAANDILSDLRRTGIVVDGRLMGAEKKKLLDRFDLLDKEEVRESSKYLALSKIFGWLSDAPGDKWENLEAKYQSRAAECLAPIISLDLNDNGLPDDKEILDIKPVLIGRL